MLSKLFTLLFFLMCMKYIKCMKVYVAALLYDQLPRKRIKQKV